LGAAEPLLGIRVETTACAFPHLNVRGSNRWAPRPVNRAAAAPSLPPRFRARLRSPRLALASATVGFGASRALGWAWHMTKGSLWVMVVLALRLALGLAATREAA